MFPSPDDLRVFLDHKVAQYNQKEFIAHDPISIPHLFSKKQDIEIMGFWAAVLAWGQRKTIINKCRTCWCCQFRCYSGGGVCEERS